MRNHIKKDSTDFQCYYFLGSCCVNNYEGKDGERFLNKSLELLTPDKASLNLIYNELACHYEQMMKFSKSLRMFKLMIENAPSSIYLKYKVAAIYDFNLKNKKEAFNRYTELVKDAQAFSHQKESGRTSQIVHFCETRINELKEEIFWDANTN